MSWSGQSWGPEQPRFVADLTGDGRADIVGFGLDGVWVSINNGNGTFQPPNMVLSAFSFHTGWMVERHPRFLADLTGDGRADIVGFGDAGVWTALNNGDGTFQPMKFVVADLGYNQGWRVDQHPRFRRRYHRRRQGRHGRIWQRWRLGRLGQWRRHLSGAEVRYQQTWATTRDGASTRTRALSRM